MERNRKIPKAIRIYVIASQYVILLFFFTFGGYYIGKTIDNNLNNEIGIFQGILGILGIILGLVLLVYQVLRLRNGK